MKKVMITGSFDPVTIGHKKIIERATKLFDKVYIAILINPEKKCFLRMEDRQKLLNLIFSNNKQTEVITSDGLAIDLAKKYEVDCFIRGVRSLNDFEYEKAMAEYNYQNGKIDTILFFTTKKLENISSSTVWEKIREGKRIDDLIPQEIIEEFLKIINKKEFLNE